MACNCKSNKNCYAKSCQRFYNNNVQNFSETPTTLQITGTRVVDSGISISTEPNNYVINKKGLYHISADVTFTALAAGLVTVQAYLDGVAMPCTLENVTATANALTPVHIETDVQFDSCCCDVSHSITFVIVGGAGVTGTVNKICSGITKVA